jgi:hypothetical protein
MTNFDCVAQFGRTDKAATVANCVAARVASQSLTTTLRHSVALMDRQTPSKRRTAREGTSAKQEPTTIALARHHRCLDIPELVDCICGYVRSLGWRNYRANLLALALTCKSIHDIAMKHLWKDLNGLGPIASVFSSDAWDVDETIQTLVRGTRFFHCL